jgi:hypothetical protein
MSQLVKTKRQGNFKDFKPFEAFKGRVEQKNVVFNSFLCKLGHSCQKRSNLRTNSLNNSSLFDEFLCKLGFFGASRPTSAKKAQFVINVM